LTHGRQRVFAHAVTHVRVIAHCLFPV
jgi:hypothetical protein